MNFIIWSYEDGPVRVEETNTLLKTYTHRCEPERFSVQAWQSHNAVIARSEATKQSLFASFEIRDCEPPLREARNDKAADP
jgi:hypothetical protein